MSFLKEFDFFAPQPPGRAAEKAPQLSADGSNQSVYDAVFANINASAEREEPVDAEEAETQKKPQREYRPRKRDAGPMRKLQEGEINLVNLWDETPMLERDHMPPPEKVYANLNEAVDSAQAWAKDHGLAYSKHKWSKGRHTRLYMNCSRAGVHPSTYNIGEKRKRRCRSQKTNCPMGFFIVAIDNLDPENSPWRVKWCLNRKSFVHNHPPEKDSYNLAVHRRATRTDEMREKLQQIWPLAKGSREAHQLVKIMFPESQWTYSDVRNEYNKYIQSHSEAGKDAIPEDHV